MSATILRQASTFSLSPRTLARGPSLIKKSLVGLASLICQNTFSVWSGRLKNIRATGEEKTWVTLILWIIASATLLSGSAWLPVPTAKQLPELQSKNCQRRFDYQNLGKGIGLVLQGHLALVIGSLRRSRAGLKDTSLVSHGSYGVSIFEIAFCRVFISSSCLGCSEHGNPCFNQRDHVHGLIHLQSHL